MPLDALKAALTAGTVDLILEMPQGDTVVYMVRHKKPAPAPSPTPIPSPTPAPTPAPSGFKVFINVGEGGFSPQMEPGSIDQHYTYPDNAWLDSLFALAPFAGVRLAFLWTRLQRTLGSALSDPDLTHIKRIVSYVTGKGKPIILDSHDYGRRGNNGTVIEGALADQYAEYWGRVAATGN